MSSAASAPKVVLSPDRLPPEVGSTMTALWLSIGFGVVVLLALWPMMLSAAPAMFPDVKDTNNLANLGWMALVVLVGSILLVGVAVSLQVRRKKKAGLRFLRLAMLGGMALGLLIVVGVIVVVMQKSDGALGPAPMISGIMFTLATLPPFIFGIFVLSYAGTDSVEAYFRPETPPEEQSYAGVGLTHAPEPAGMVTEAAEEPQPRAQSSYPAEASPGVLADDRTRETHVFVQGPETMVRPEEEARGAARQTMLAPATDSLDDIFQEELAEQAAKEAAPVSDIGAPPLSPEALDAIFSGEEAEAPDVVPAGADRDMPGSFSDSIFDEEDAPHLQPDDSKRPADSILAGPDSKTTGESSIFSEANAITGSGVISGMSNEPAIPEMTPGESGQPLQPSKQTMIQKGPKPDEEESKGEQK